MLKSLCLGRDRGSMLGLPTDLTSIQHSALSKTKTLAPAGEQPGKLLADSTPVVFEGRPNGVLRLQQDGRSGSPTGIRRGRRRSRQSAWPDRTWHQLLHSTSSKATYPHESGSGNWQAREKYVEQQQSSRKRRIAQVRCSSLRPRSCCAGSSASDPRSHVSVCNVLRCTSVFVYQQSWLKSALPLHANWTTYALHPRSLRLQKQLRRVSTEQADDDLGPRA
jgi:hypothetical protein